MENKIKHTPVPWSMDMVGICAGSTVIVDGKKVIARPEGETLEDHANVQLIIRAVNSHEALLKIAKDVLADEESQLNGNNEYCDFMRKTIALAEDK